MNAVFRKNLTEALAINLLGCDNGVDCDTGGKERRRQWCPNSQSSKKMNGAPTGIGAMRS
jgi:hypothetical protein